MDRNNRGSSATGKRTYGREWRTRVMYGYLECLRPKVSTESDFWPALADKLCAEPELLEYRREDWPHNKWESVGGLDRPPLAHWLSQEQVAQLPAEMSTVIFDDLPPYREPLDFIAGVPEGGNVFEEAIRAGALPQWDAIELGLIALRLFTLDRFKNARPDLLMNEVDDPQRAQEWWERCAHLIALLRDMQADYEAVLANVVASGASPDEEEA